MGVSACSDKQDTDKPSINKPSKQVPVGSEAALLDKANKLWAEKKMDLAEAKFRKAVELSPESAKANTRLAGFLLTQNKTEEAISVYQKAIMLDSRNPKLFAALSLAYLHQSKFDMAKVMADQAMALDPEMKQVKKLNAYIEARQEIIEQASKVPTEKVNAGVMPSNAMHKPNDAVHIPSKHGDASHKPATPVAPSAPVAPVTPTAEGVGAAVAPKSPEGLKE